MTIGENIKRIRTEKGLTQKQLGELCEPKMADSAIRRYELGKANPKIETLCKIADALNVSIILLVEGCENKYPLSGIDFLINIEDSMTDKENAITSYVNVANYGDLELVENMDLLKQRTKYYALYNQLNNTGKQEAIKRVSELTEKSLYTEPDEE